MGLGSPPETRLRGSVESAVELVPAGVECSSEIQTGGPLAVLLHAARDLDLLVLGSRGYGPVRRVLLGSVSRQLVRAAACPVLVVPRPARLRPSIVARHRTGERMSGPAVLGVRAGPPDRATTEGLCLAAEDATSRVALAHPRQTAGEARELDRVVSPLRAGY